MAITVQFMKNLSSNKFLTKLTQNLGNPVQCDIYNPTDRISPTLLVDMDKISLTDTNYCEIPEFGRKYFITSIVPEAGKRATVSCHVDVLSTYDAAIRNCKCIAERSTTQYNMYLQDNQRVFNTYPWNQYINIHDVGAPDTIILMNMHTAPKD